jgi:hypothetical protein
LTASFFTPESPHPQELKLPRNVGAFLMMTDDKKPFCYLKWQTHLETRTKTSLARVGSYYQSGLKTMTKKNTKSVLPRFIELTGFDANTFLSTVSTSARYDEDGETTIEEHREVCHAPNQTGTVDQWLNVCRMDIDNRQKRFSHVRILADIMRSGDWIAGAKTIHLAVVNGQFVVVDGGHTIYALIVRDADEDQLRELWLISAIHQQINAEQIKRDVISEVPDFAEREGWDVPEETIDTFGNVDDELLQRIGWVTLDKDGTPSQAMPEDTPSMTQRDFVRSSLGRELCDKHVPADFRTAKVDESEEDDSKGPSPWVVKEHDFSDYPIEVDVKIGLDPRWYGLADQVGLRRQDVDTILKDKLAYLVAVESDLADKLNVLATVSRNLYKVGRTKTIRDKETGEHHVLHGTMKGSGKSYNAEKAPFWVTTHGDQIVSAGQALKEARAFFEVAKAVDDATFTLAQTLDPLAPENAVAPTEKNIYGHPGASPTRLKEWMILTILATAWDGGIGLEPVDDSPLSNLGSLAFSLAYGMQPVKNKKTKQWDYKEDHTFSSIRDYFRQCRVGRTSPSPDIVAAMVTYLSGFWFDQSQDVYDSVVNTPRKYKDVLSEMGGIIDVAGKDAAEAVVKHGAFRWEGIASGWDEDLVKLSNGTDPSRGRGRPAKSVEDEA